MPLRFRFAVIVISCGVALFAHPGAAAPPATVPADPRIAAAVRQLGDENYTRREAATRRLAAAGRRAEAALSVAAGSEDLEIATRAGSLLKDLRLGLSLASPAEARALAEEYADAEAARKQEIVGRLAGMSQYVAAMRLTEAPADSEIRESVVRLLAGRPGVAAVLLGAGETEAFERLLEHAAGPQQRWNTVLPDYAAYLLLHGGLDARIDALRRAPPNSANPVFLALLYRAKGDLAAARAAAREAELDSLSTELGQEAGDWKSLVETFELAAVHAPEINTLAPAAGVHYLAGDNQLDSSLERLTNFTERTPSRSWFAGKAFFLCGRPEEGIQFLMSHGEETAAFQFLVLQERFDEAFELVDRAAREHTTQLPSLLMQARARLTMGQRDQAMALYEKARGQPAGQGAHDIAWANSAWVPFLMAAGEREKAMEIALPAFSEAKEQDSYRAGVLIEQLVQKTSGHEEAWVWWEYFRQKFPEDSPRQAFDRVAGLLQGKIPRPDLETLASDAAEQALAIAGEEERTRRVEIFAQTLRARGCDAVAQRCLQHLADAGTFFDPLVRLGDIAADRGDWPAAEQCYADASARDPSHPSPLYLRGWALLKMGQADEGRRLMELARLLPLGDTRRRINLAEVMRQHGLNDEAAHEEELVRLTGPFDNYFTNDASRLCGNEAHRRGDDARAADLLEHSIFPVFRSNTTLSNDAAFLAFPSFIHRLRAGAALDARHLEPGLQEAKIALAYLPGDTQVPIELFPKLQAMGRTAEADELFDSVFAVQDTLLQEYPNAGIAHNSLAWLCAKCRRRLDVALEHATRAVELEPRNPAFIDTLAETYFQRGDASQAAATIRRAIEVDPDNAAHRKQLERFGAVGSRQ